MGKIVILDRAGLIAGETAVKEPFSEQKGPIHRAKASSGIVEPVEVLGLGEYVSGFLRIDEDGQLDFLYGFCLHYFS